MDVDAFAKTKGGKKGGKGKDKEPEAKKFDGGCFWCGASWPCRWRTVARKQPGGLKRPSRRKLLNRKPRAKAKEAQERRGPSSLDEWPDGQEEQPSGEKSGRGSCEPVHGRC